MIRPAQKSDAIGIAMLHQRTLTNSFLAKLGIRFLESLYVFLVKKELVIVYAEGAAVKGFVSFSYNSSDMMKRFLFSSPACVIKLLGILITSPTFLKRLIETFSAPFKSKTSLSSTTKVILPDAELLSISVDPNCQNSGIGSKLLEVLENQLKQCGIPEYKVIAGMSLDSANKFYLSKDFTFASQITIHGNELSNIYIKQLSI